MMSSETVMPGDGSEISEKLFTVLFLDVADMREDIIYLIDTYHSYMRVLNFSIYKMTQSLLLSFRPALGAGEIAQWVRVPDCSSEGQEFKSQQPHGG